MPLSWNEIKSRAISFSNEWKDTEREEADAKEFLVEFLNVFGITRRRVATFEHKIKKLSEADGYIDLLWPGMLLVEMKSKGKDLEKAYKQSKEYCHGLKEYELPKLIMVSDFHTFHVYDADSNKSEFTLPDFLKHIQLFSPLAGYQKRSYKEQDPVNIQAAERMGKLYDSLKAAGYHDHDLQLYLVRLLFCLFADDTSIFEKGMFTEYILLKTAEDGTDLAAYISQIFQVLNTPETERMRNLDENLAAFPYINGKLFEATLPMASYDSNMRKLLLDCCALDWGKISPAIFGSLFQSVMDEKARRNLGAHYTSEKNILKLIKPLFLDDLYEEFESIKNDKKKLQKLHDKISKFRFLDPACGCGNFLIIAYRELRMLELEIVKLILKGQQVTSINDYFLLDVDRFYGIEYEEFPCQIAQVAMWLMDHQLNELCSLQFGEYYKRIPLKKSATIVHGNALRVDWQSLIDPVPWEKEEPRFHYIMGNPPFIGMHLLNSIQKEDMVLTFKDFSGWGVLDYVTCWYIKAAEYIQGLKTKVAFVSTNSISQGEQVSAIWNVLFLNYKIKIHFAHRTFKWGNEARSVAAVHVVIIGFANYDTNEKYLYEYDNIKGEAHEGKVVNINPYLVEGKDMVISPQSKSICKVPSMSRGNSPYDNGNLIIAEDEIEDFLINEPKAKPFIKELISAKEFLNGKKRWCLWLKDANPTELRNLPLIQERIKKVYEFRINSKGVETQKYAPTPYLFRDLKNPDSFIVIPRHSSENRDYIPMGFFTKDYIPSDSCMIIANGKLFHFGILMSKIHMTWVKNVCGRIKSDYRYSKDIVYNNFPWPENPSTKQKKKQLKKLHKLS